MNTKNEVLKGEREAGRKIKVDVELVEHYDDRNRLIRTVSFTKNGRPIEQFKLTPNGEIMNTRERLCKDQSLFERMKTIAPGIKHSLRGVFIFL